MEFNCAERASTYIADAFPTVVCFPRFSIEPTVTSRHVASMDPLVHDLFTSTAAYFTLDVFVYGAEVTSHLAAPSGGPPRRGPLPMAVLRAVSDGCLFDDFRDDRDFLAPRPCLYLNYTNVETHCSGLERFIGRLGGKSKSWTVRRVHGLCALPQRNSHPRIQPACL